MISTGFIFFGYFAYNFLPFVQKKKSEKNFENALGQKVWKKNQRQAVRIVQNLQTIKSSGFDFISAVFMLTHTKRTTRKESKLRR